MQKIKLLYIEDENVFVKAYDRLIKCLNSEMVKKGFGITIQRLLIIDDMQTAAQLIESWEDENEPRPDLIFLDIMLPKTPDDAEKLQKEKTIKLNDNRIDTQAGYQLYKQMRDKKVDIPIVVFTANYRIPRGTVSEMQENERVMWLEKPYIIEEIIDNVIDFIKTNLARGNKE